MGASKAKRARGPHLQRRAGTALHRVARPADQGAARRRRTADARLRRAAGDERPGLFGAPGAAALFRGWSHAVRRARHGHPQRRRVLRYHRQHRHRRARQDRGSRAARRERARGHHEHHPDLRRHGAGRVGIAGGHRPAARGDSGGSLKRRAAIGVMAASAAAVMLRRRPSALARATPVTKPIPSSGEKIPVVGLGSWITFNVGDDPELRDECAAVMRAFFQEGGRLIDSSPMYGSSQGVIGYGLAKLGRPPTLFAADKVWISSGSRGPQQIEASRTRWGVPRFDLLQVHNLLDWEDHLPTLFAMKAEGRVRYVGVTTSEGRRHREKEKNMRSQPIDLVQVTYNALQIDPLTLHDPFHLAVAANLPRRHTDLKRT